MGHCRSCDNRKQRESYVGIYSIEPYRQHYDGNYAENQSPSKITRRALLGLEKEGCKHLYGPTTSIRAKTLEDHDSTTPMGWSGHVARRSQEYLSKAVADWHPTTKGRPGRPRASWLWNQPIEAHLHEHRERWQATAANRDSWKRKGCTWVSEEYTK